MLFRIQHYYFYGSRTDVDTHFEIVSHRNTSIYNKRQPTAR
jgi:hypothetical protein